MKHPLMPKKHQKKQKKKKQNTNHKHTTTHNHNPNPPPPGAGQTWNIPWCQRNIKSYNFSSGESHIFSLPKGMLDNPYFPKKAQDYLTKRLLCVYYLAQEISSSFSNDAEHFDHA